MPPKKLALSDTNLALVGSDIHKKIQENVADGEPAWRNAGTKPGLQIWRVEKFKIAAWPPDEYGTFFKGDSYIILQTHAPPAGTSRAPDKFDVFFWLGSETSQDEAGTAAIKVCELDNGALGGKPVQHREVEGHETGQFLALFGGKIDIQEGGIASGFTKVVKEKFPPRLFHLRSTGGIAGTKSFQRPPVVDSLNEDDCFLLDDGDKTVYIFQGKTCSPGERMKSSMAASNIVQNRARGVATRVVTSDDAPPEFWKLLGVESGTKPDNIKAQPDEENAAESRTLKLFRIRAQPDGEIVTLKVTEGAKVPMSAFDITDAMLLDTGTEIWVWIGEEADPSERSNAMARAQTYLNSQPGRSPATPISRICEGFEPAFFFELVVHDVPSSGKLREYFDDADTNGDGVLDKSEIAALFAYRFPSLGAAEVARRIAQLDRNSDGLISFEEFKGLAKDFAAKK